MTEAIEAVTTICGRKIPYRVVHSKRARRLRVTVSGAEVTVTLPAGVQMLG